ncbi:hypothetical protein GGU11DRAFT_748140 [Lentinula aff. detonsa]|nr:hypothetical protein GGU11DRAFT_748140 [Lentinula aff. detonsa]
MAVTSIRCFSRTSLPSEARCGSHGKLSYDPGLKAALTPVLSPTTAHCIYYCRRPDVNASSMLIQNIFPESPQSCPRHYYEPSNDKMLLHSGLFRYRHISENRALATWISLCIQHKLVLYDPGICFDERELLDTLTYKLTKSLQFLNSPTPAIFITLLYLYRIFPDHIPYFGNPDEELVRCQYDLNPLPTQLKPSPSRKGGFSNQRYRPARLDGFTLRFKRSQLPRSPFPNSTTSSISSILYGASKLLIERLLGD